MNNVLIVVATGVFAVLVALAQKWDGRITRREQAKTHKVVEAVKVTTEAIDVAVNRQPVEQPTLIDRQIGQDSVSMDKAEELVDFREYLVAANEAIAKGLNQLGVRVELPTAPPVVVTEPIPIPDSFKEATANEPNTDGQDQE